MNRPSPWLPYFRPDPAASLRLVCFPYAGGGASLFNAWRRELPAGVEVCAVQLPGRETRLAEPPFRRIEPLVEAVAEALAPSLGTAYVLFGHSMGARIAFELARHFDQTGGPRPLHLFVSGCRAAQIPRDDPPVHQLPDESFTRELRRLNGIPEAVLADRELRELFLPILRADFEIVETYRYRPGRLLDCPITALGGSRDPKADRSQLEGWREQTTRGVAVHVLPGDHFFIQAQRAKLLQIVSDTLVDQLSMGPP